MLNIETDINQSSAVHLSYFENHLAKKLPSYNLNTGYFYKKELNRVRLFESEVKYPGWVFIVLGHRVYHLRHKNPELYQETAGGAKCCKYDFMAVNFAPVTADYIDHLLNNARSYAAPAPVYQEPVPVQETKVMPLHSTQSFSNESQEYADFIEDVLQRIRTSLVTKGLEYHRNGNPYHNFDSTAQMNKQLPERALWGFVSKQITSLLDMIEDLERGKLPSVALVEEKCGDVRNYAILLEGLIKRTIGVSQQYTQVAA